MRKFLVIVPAVALPVILAASLAASGGSSGRDDAGEPSSPDGGVVPATTEPAPSVQAAPGPRPTGPPVPSSASGPAPGEPQAAPEPDPGPQFVCPEGGMAEVVALQQAVDDGHQPWRLSAPDVAAACTFGVGGASVEAEPPGPNTYRVTSDNGGGTMLVEVAQPLGPGTIWVVTRATPAR